MGDAARKNGPANDAGENDEKEVLQSEQQPKFKVVPQHDEPGYFEPADVVEKRYKELGVKTRAQLDKEHEEKFGVTNEQEGTVFAGSFPDKSVQNGPDMFDEYAQNPFETDFDFGEKVFQHQQKMTREAVAKATKTALEKPLKISLVDAGTKTGAQILSETYGAHSKEKDSSVLETQSGPMLIMSGLEAPKGYVIPYKGTKIYAATSPGLVHEGGHDKNPLGVVLKPSVKDKKIRMFMTKGQGEGAFLRDQAAVLANAAATEAGALMLTEEQLHLQTVLVQMNRSVNKMKDAMGIKKQVAPMIGAEIDMKDPDTAIMKVASAGSIRCVIVNPESGSVKALEPQTVETKLRSKVPNKEQRDAVLDILAMKQGRSMEETAKSLTTAGGMAEDAFLPEITEYKVPAGFVVLFATNEMIDNLGGGSRASVAIGRLFREETQKGATVDQVLSKLYSNYHKDQKAGKTFDTGSGIVGIQIPGKLSKGRHAIETTPSSRRPAPIKDLDFSDLD